MARRTKAEAAVVTDEAAEAGHVQQNDERLHSIELTLNAVPLVTPEAGVRILHQALVELLALMREVNAR